MTFNSSQIQSLSSSSTFLSVSSNICLDMEYVVESENKLESMVEDGKETLITHLSVKEVDKEAERVSDTVCDILENKSIADLEIVEEILIDDLVFRKVSTLSPATLNDTTEMDNAILDNILDNIKGLEDENFLLREKLKSEQERFKMEKKEKISFQLKLAEQKNQIENLKSHICFNQVKIHCVEEAFHGFEDNDVIETLIKKVMLDKTVMDEETAVKALESVLKQTKRRNLMEKLIRQEEDTMT
eukprot:GFUD01008391.1.p1 GENE.GFUD01008391.1~~GFUD01008391.1.p1  ORF type:complete len:244 (-),score=75.81 GFUD01008391.1:72-803(-)